MLDTISHAIRGFRIDPGAIKRRQFTSRSAFGQHSRLFKREPEDKGNVIICEFADPTRDCVIVQTSVAKYLLGSNIFEVDDGALDLYASQLANDLVGYGVHATAEEIKNSELKRVDFCRNLPFKGDPGAYLDSLVKVSQGFKSDVEDVSYRNQSGTTGRQIIVENQSFRSTVYDKLAEAGKKEGVKEVDEFKASYPGHALLRIEHSLLDGPAIRRYLLKYGIEPNLKSVWSEKLSQTILSRVFAENFNDGEVLTSEPEIVVRSDTDPMIKAGLYQVRGQGLAQVLSEWSAAYSSVKYCRLKRELIAQLQNQPDGQSMAQQIHHYLKNFKPILKPNYALN